VVVRQIAARSGMRPDGLKANMSWRTNTVVVIARNAGRALGVNRRIARLLNGSGYETRYDNALSATVRAGDTVWDVGANVGYYTRVYAAKVGANGRVFSFEPSPVNFPRLVKATAEMTNVTPLQLGLGDRDAELSFSQGADDLGATSRIVEAGAGELVVQVRTGAGLIEARTVPQPNAIKIDVEGFELEVLQGLSAHLSDQALRAIGIEVHFGILKARGIPGAPARIEQVLERAGFDVSWPDSSHILALRARQ
jgi:FkbM family methyltransferase